MTELKRNEVLSFDDGLLIVKMSGHGQANGWATLAFDEKQFELDDEGYQVVEIPPSELFELRDFLNRILPADRSGDQVSAAGPAAAPLNRDPGVVAAVQEALMKHPFWKPGLGSSGFAFGLANTAIDAYCTAVSRPERK